MADQGKPFVDDQGKVVITPAGEHKGLAMSRPAGGHDPHFFILQGNADKLLLGISFILPGPPGAALFPALLWEGTHLANFRQGGSWDEQRLDGHYHEAFVDYANVAIGLYAAAAGILEPLLLTTADIYAGHRSQYQEPLDHTYTHMSARDVADIKLGYDLVTSGRIHDTIQV